MENHIDLLRNIVKNFKYSNEFDDIIKKILNKIFNNYYVNREKYIYCIDNLYKKYDISKYNFIKKKYKLSKNENLIYRFNKYNKKYYIIKLLEENNIKENYEVIVNEILKNDIKNYKEYVKEGNYKQDDFKIISNKRFCHYVPCFNKIIGTYNYCHLHNENTI